MALYHESGDELSRTIIGFAIEVHRELRPGLLESNYEDALCIELENAGIPFRRQTLVPVFYKGRRLSSTFRSDLQVANSVIVEVKAIEKLAPIHSAQTLTYMRHTGMRVGLLFNFHAIVLKDQMKRFVL